MVVYKMHIKAVCHVINMSDNANMAGVLCSY